MKEIKQHLEYAYNLLTEARQQAIGIFFQLSKPEQLMVLDKKLEEVSAELSKLNGRLTELQLMEKVHEDSRAQMEERLAKAIRTSKPQAKPREA